MFDSMMPKPLEEQNQRSEPVKPDTLITSKYAIRLELILTVDNIVFILSSSRKEDQKYLPLTQKITINQNTEIMEQQQEEQGMYINLSTVHFFVLTDYLLRIHNYTKQYNYTLLQNI